MKPHHKKTGLTLIELLVAITIGSIVLLASSSLLIGQWAQNKRFLDQEITMNEIQNLSVAFCKEAREKSSISNYVDGNNVEFTNDAGDTSSFTYNSSNKSIIYTDKNNKQIEMLPNSIVSGFQVSPNTTKMLTMVIKITETELNNIENEYQIIATSRN